MKIPAENEQSKAPCCPYCNNISVLAAGQDIYPHRTDLKKKIFYKCEPCGAFVGCHAETLNPLDRLANAELRREKMRAHSAFDPLWKDGLFSRTEAYTWLATALNIRV